MVDAVVCKMRASFGRNEAKNLDRLGHILDSELCESAYSLPLSGFPPQLTEPLDYGVEIERRVGRA